MARPRPQDDVELNVTAMLDLAFQLLAFFILTFRAAPLEPAVQLHMPPAQAVAERPEIDNVVKIVEAGPVGTKTLRVGLYSRGTELDRITVNGVPVENFPALSDALAKFITRPGTPIEWVVIQASEGLRYEEVMKVVDVCMKNKLPTHQEFVKLTLVAIGNES